jgi:hypothetical protein
MVTVTARKRGSLTWWIGVLFDKRAFAQSVTKGLLPTTGSHCYQLNPVTSSQYFFMIHFNNIFQSISGSPNLCRPFKFSDQNFVTPRSKTPYWETDSCSPVQEIPHLSYIPNIHNCVLNKQPLYLYQDSWTQLIFSQPVSSLLMFKLSFHLHLFSLLFRFLKLFFLQISNLCHSWHMSHPSFWAYLS